MPLTAAERSKRYYSSEKGKATLRRHREKRRIIQEALAVGCACGEIDLRCLDFHHVRGEKLFNLSRWPRKSIQAIRAEIEKCVVLCANCHRKEHA